MFKAYLALTFAAAIASPEPRAWLVGQSIALAAAVVAGYLLLRRHIDDRLDGHRK